MHPATVANLILIDLVAHHPVDHLHHQAVLVVHHRFKKLDLNLHLPKLAKLAAFMSAG